jgi:serine/threonine protein kinase
MIDPRFAAEHNITEEAEILLQATILFGEVPMELIKAGTRGEQFYADNSGMLYFSSLRPGSLCYFCFSDKLSGVRIEVTDFDLHKLIEMDPPHDLPASDIDLFVDFLSRMVKILPRERETPAQLLKHPWLQEVTYNFCFV